MKMEMQTGQACCDVRYKVEYENGTRQIEKGVDMETL